MSKLLNDDIVTKTIFYSILNSNYKQLSLIKIDEYIRKVIIYSMGDILLDSVEIQCNKQQKAHDV